MFLLLSSPLFAQSNPELDRIYDQDQKDRVNWQSLTPADRDALIQKDAARRKRVGELVRSGALKSAEDYEHAAFVFQHGEESADFLMAHVLAMTASAIEPQRGAWIATATLDRYLVNIGKAQVFGTQLDSRIRFDKDFIPDAVRAANCVPSVADRERLVNALAKNQPLPLIDPCAANPAAIAGKWSLVERLADGSTADAQLELNPAADDQIGALTENGRTRDLDEINLGGRELRFREADREFRVTINGDTISGTVTQNGKSGSVVGLRKR